MARYDAMLRADFAAFAHRAFCELNPRASFAMNWHYEAIAAKLAAVYHRRIGRLIINVPPRYLKSHPTSVAFPAWCLGNDPSLQMICASYAQDLADKLAHDCRRVMTSDWYQRLFFDPAGTAASGGAGVRDHRARLPACHLGRRRADRPGCRHDHHRRPAKAGRGAVAGPAPSRQRVVRPHPLQPPQRQAEGGDRADHEPAARGRPRRPCAGAGGVGGGFLSGDCRGGRDPPDRDGAGDASRHPVARRGAAPRARAARHARADPPHDRRI